MSKQWRITNVEWHTAEDVTFDMAVSRLAEFVATGRADGNLLVSMSRAIGRAFGASPEDVLDLATTEVATAWAEESKSVREATLGHFPSWAQGPGVDA